MTGMIGYALAALLAGGAGGYLLRGRGSAGQLESRLIGVERRVDLAFGRLSEERSARGEMEAGLSGRNRDLSARVDQLSKELLKLENKVTFSVGEAHGLVDRLTGEFRAMAEAQANRLDQNEERVHHLSREVSASAEALRSEIARAVQEGVKGLISREEVQSAFAEVARATAAQQIAQQQAAAAYQQQRREEVFGRTQPPAPPAPAPARIPATEGLDVTARLEALNRRIAEITGQAQA